jgi:hypothetical protein
MLQALRDEVIVKPVYQDKVGCIEIPEGSRFGKNSGHGQFRLYHGFIYGHIISVGPKYKETFDGRILQSGDKVIWTRNEGKRLFWDRQEYLLLKSKHVLATIKDSYEAL